MRENYYISEEAFELLVRSQSSKPLLLPCEAALENQSEEAVLYIIGELCDLGALIANKENERFDISKEFAQMLTAILTAKTIVQCRGVFDDDSHFGYIGRSVTTFIDIPANRFGKLRMGIASLDDFAAEIMERLDPDSTSFLFPEKLRTDLPQMSVEDVQSVASLSNSFSEIMELQGIIALVDFYSADSADVKGRLCIFVANGTISVLHTKSGQTTCDPYSPEIWNRLLTESAEVSE